MEQSICGRVAPTKKKKAPTAATVRAVITGKPLLSVLHNISITEVFSSDNDFSEMEGIWVGMIWMGILIFLSWMRFCKCDLKIIEYRREVFNIDLLLFIAAGVFWILLFKYIRLKKQIRSLSKQMEELTCGNTEKILDISLIDKDLEKLAGILNGYKDKQRQAISITLKHEKHLKESIANMSHDLCTPLTVILGHLQLLKKEDLQKNQRKRVETILNKAERMKEMVEIFYDLSVLDTEQVNPQME